MKHCKPFRSISKSRAVTLVELLVVIVILCIIGAGVGTCISGNGKIEIKSTNKQNTKTTVTVTHGETVTHGDMPPAKNLQEWTPETIAKDPKKYSEYVEERLKDDVKKFEAVNRELQLRMETLAQLITDNSKRIAKGEPIAEEFADAITNGKFPAMVSGKEYTESQLRTQLALILAQLGGCKESLADITKGQETAQEEIKKNFLAIGKTETKIALLAAERAVWESRATSAEGVKLIETVNAALTGNDVILKDNPVRSLDDIIKQAEQREVAKQSVTNSDVDEYLREHESKKKTK